MADLALGVADTIVGLVLLGAAAATAPRQRRVGLVMAAASVTWFLGSLASPLLFLHRGPMVQLHISYPTGRLRRPLAVGAVAVAYVAALFDSLARNAWLTGALAILIVVAAADVFRRTSGPARKAGVPALAAASLFAGILALSSANGLFGLDLDRPLLYAYDAVVCFVVVWLSLDLRYGKWTDATLADLVAQLSDRARIDGLQSELRKRLGDPTIVLGVRLAGSPIYVDETGAPVDVEAEGRVCTPITEAGEVVAVLVHDVALLDDPALLRGATGALSLAVANARMRAEVQMQVSELALSRRRIVEAADVQRRMIARAVMSGPERHIQELARILDRPSVTEDPGITAQLPLLRAEAETGVAELRQFAHGVRPTALDAAGLSVALPAFAANAPQPTSISVSLDRLAPAVEAAVYFVCAEALTNVAKHANASRAQVTVTMDAGDVVATVSDDGRAGADPTGSGLRGLADRVEALGGTLRIVRRVEGGTAVEARIPARQVAEP